MFDNIFETIVRGSNTVFLSMPEEDYKFSYGALTLEAAQEIADNYFLTRAKDGVPRVQNISVDPGTHAVKITLELENLENCSGDYYSIPDTLNIERKDE